MSRQHLDYVGFIAAILSAVSWFVFAYGQLNLPDLSKVDDPLLFFQAIDDAQFVYLLYGWGGILGTLLCIPYLVAFYKAMEQTAPMMLLVLIVSLIGVALTILGFFKPLIIVYFHTPLGLAGTADTLPLLKVAVEVSLELFEGPWFLGSFLLFSLGFGLTATYAWRTATGPRWLNGAGIVAGLAGLVWLTPFLPSFLDSLTPLLILVNIVASIFWSIGLSLVLVNQR